MFHDFFYEGSIEAIRAWGMIIGHTFDDILNFLLTEVSIKVLQIVGSQQRAKIIGQICEFTFPKSLLEGSPKDASLLFMISNNSAIRIYKRNNEISLMCNYCHGMEKTCIFISQGDPS